MTSLLSALLSARRQSAEPGSPRACYGRVAAHARVVLALVFASGCSASAPDAHEPMLSVGGRVVDTEGRGAAGARVILSTATDGPTRHSWWQPTELSGLRQELWEDYGYGGSAVVEQDPRQELRRMCATEEEVILGRSVADVPPERRDEALRLLRGEVICDLATTETDGEGVFHFAITPRGGISVITATATIESGGFTWTGASRQFESGRTRISLRPVATLDVFASSGGAPVEGARVAFEWQDSEDGSRHWVSKSTDASGHARLLTHHPTVNVSVHKRGFDCERSIDVLLDKPVHSVELRLTPKAKQPPPAPPGVHLEISELTWHAVHGLPRQAWRVLNAGSYVEEQITVVERMTGKTWKVPASPHALIECNGEDVTIQTVDAGRPCNVQTNLSALDGDAGDRALAAAVEIGPVTIDVPAGTFACTKYRIYFDGDDALSTDEVWIAKGVPVVVKDVFTTPERTTTSVLAKCKLVPR